LPFISNLGIRGVMRSFALITVVTVLGACRPPPDPERDARENYMEHMVGVDDAGARWPLASKSYLHFARGFHGIEAAKEDAGDVWRWAEKRAELRVRARAEGRLAIRIRGRGFHADLKPSITTVSVNGTFVQQFGTHEDFNTVIEIAQNARAEQTFVVVFDSSRAFHPPDDGRELAFSLTDVSWQ
jgi:hypothetical protein